MPDRRAAAEVLTLAAVAARPECVTTRFVSPAGDLVEFRPLEPGEQARLADFLQGLSSQTRRFSTYPGYDRAAARELCAAINRYDKLRMVATAREHVVALLEFSFSITVADRERYRTYGIELDERTDCRFGPCIVDAYQNQRLGSALLPLMMEIARRFGKRCVILWGGVLADNGRAIGYYERHGFRMLGCFRNSFGAECRDGMLLLGEGSEERLAPG